MPRVSPDFSEALDLSPLPPGTYKVRLTDVESKTSKAGNHYLNWKLTTFGSENSSTNNRVIFYSTMTSGKGAGSLKALLAATGKGTGEFDTEELLGKEVRVTVIQGRDQDGNPSDFPSVKAVAAI